MFENLNTFLNTILLGIGIGFLPSIIWLLFWLREDPHPEPTKTLIKAFVYGMLSVPFAIILQLWIMGHIGYTDIMDIVSRHDTRALIIVFVLWAAIEEILKLIFGTREMIQKDDNEPVDPAIYMITTALGFAALENVLFIIFPLFDGDFSHVATATQMRFMGATLLHVLTSGLIGLVIGYMFYKSRFTKIFWVSIATCGAIALHAAFNIFIILYETRIFAIFAILWVVVIVFILAIERLKFIGKN